jgi:symplekin
LAAVFTHAPGEVKRSIIKLLPQPIQNMSMNSPELFRLLEDMPKGAETMITRVLHIVTEKGKLLFFISSIYSFLGLCKFLFFSIVKGKLSV